MGHVLHHAIIVTSWESVVMAAARRKAQELGLSVTSMARSEVNLYGTFLVAPDGSQSGWQGSEDGDARRDAFIAWMRQQRHRDGSSYLGWVEVSYGSDDREAQVTRHEWQDAPPASKLAEEPAQEACDKLRAEVERLRADANARAVEELTNLRNLIGGDANEGRSNGYNAACGNYVYLIGARIAELSKPAAKESEPVPNGCVVDSYSSRCCDRGTKSCDLDHAQDERCGDWPLRDYVAGYNPLTASPLETAVYHLCKMAVRK